MLPTICVCNKIRRSARIVSAFYDEALAPAGLTVARFSLLRMLERAGPSSLSDFAEATGYDRTTLNRTLAPLVAEGLVDLGPGKDRRSRTVAITDLAKQVMHRTQPYWNQAQARIQDALGPDYSKFFEILDRIEEMR